MNHQETWQDTLKRIPAIPVPSVVESVPLSQGKHIHLTRKTIQKPNNDTYFYEGTERPVSKGVISVLSTTSEKVCILIAEYRPLIAPYWNISLPAGLVDPGYTVEETVKKELLEETGYHGKDPRFLVCVAPSPGMSSEIISQFYIGDVIPTSEGQRLESNEIIEVLRVPLSEMDDFMRTVAEKPDIFLVDAKVSQAIYFARLKGYL